MPNIDTQQILNLIQIKSNADEEKQDKASDTLKNIIFLLEKTKKAQRFGFDDNIGVKIAELTPQAIHFTSSDETTFVDLTVIEYAVVWGNLPAFKLLLAFLADVDLQSDLDKKDTSKKLLEKLREIAAQGNYGLRLLSLACFYVDNYDVAEFLLTNIAFNPTPSTTTFSNQVCSPLLTAVKKNHAQLTRLLLPKGFHNIEETINNESALSFASNMAAKTESCEIILAFDALTSCKIALDENNNANATYKVALAFQYHQDFCLDVLGLLIDEVNTCPMEFAHSNEFIKFLIKNLYGLISNSGSDLEDFRQIVYRLTSYPEGIFDKTFFSDLPGGSTEFLQPYLKDFSAEKSIGKMSGKDQNEEKIKPGNPADKKTDAKPKDLSQEAGKLIQSKLVQSGPVTTQREIFKLTTRPQLVDLIINFSMYKTQVTKPIAETSFGTCKKLSDKEKQKLLAKHDEQLDYDNHTIPNVANRLLMELGIKAKISAIMFGQNKPDVAFDYVSGFNNAIGYRCHKESDFVLFSYPSLQQKHSVAVIIDVKNNKIFLIDSENNTNKAIDETKEAMNKAKVGTFVETFETISTIFARPPQQNAQFEPTVCGEYSIRNMVCTVLFLTRTFPDKSLAQYLTPLNPLTGTGYLKFQNSTIHTSWILAIECILNSNQQQATPGLEL